MGVAEGQRLATGCGFGGTGGKKAGTVPASNLGPRLRGGDVEGPRGDAAQYTTTERIDSPRFIRSKPSLIWSSDRWWVIRSSMLILFSMYQSTMRGTSVRPRAPPKAEPFHTRPVTSWNGRVAISWPAPATPMMTLTPQPLWQHSSACRIVFTLPMHSKL